MNCKSCSHFCKIVNGKVVNDCEIPKTAPYEHDAENLCSNFYPCIDTIYYAGTISKWDVEKKKFIDII